MLQLIFELLDSLIQETSNFKTQAVIFPFIQPIVTYQESALCQALLWTWE